LRQLDGSLKTNSGNKVNTAKRKRKDHVDTASNQNSKFIADVIKLISDDKTWLIFNTIFLAGGDRSETLRTELKLTRKQYHSRMSSLIKAGLAKRQKGKYFVTTFGSVIFDTYRLLGTAIKDYWKLKAIDSLGATNDSKMPKEQRKKIIEELIGNRQLRDISLSTKF
jgi:DNA-binding HxlR family transcriptional regulator